MPFEIIVDKLQSQNTVVVQKLDTGMPQYHSRAMHQNFMRMFGRVTGVTLAYLREIYCQFIGDVSALSSENKKDIDECVRQAIELEDAEVVVDLRHHNIGQPSKYDPFIEVCKQYIKSSIEVAVDDGRHDRIAHLAIALSVNDLLSEVSKVVGHMSWSHLLSVYGSSFGQKFQQLKQLCITLVG